MTKVTEIVMTVDDAASTMGAIIGLNPELYKVLTTADGLNELLKYGICEPPKPGYTAAAQALVTDPSAKTLAAYTEEVKFLKGFKLPLAPGAVHPDEWENVVKAATVTESPIQIDLGQASPTEAATEIPAQKEQENPAPVQTEENMPTFSEEILNMTLREILEWAPEASQVDPTFAAELAELEEELEAEKKGKNRAARVAAMENELEVFKAANASTRKDEVSATIEILKQAITMV